ncbi:MAG: hypothetical protein PHR82_09075 [Endomicrobiaceae bacterium]|nr:hypothetical protein [Endomicrobiaceae bacterium]
MKNVVSCIVTLLLLVQPVFAGSTVKFTSTEGVDPVAFAKKNLNINAKKLKKLGIKKLVILECYGDYVTSKEVTNSANSQRYTGWIRTNTDTLEFDKDYYTVTSNLVYEAVKEAFEENGIEIVSKADLQSNEIYTDFNLEEEKAGRGVTAGLYKPTTVELTQTVSTTGLGIFPMSPLKRIKLIIKLGEITNGVGAEGFVQVNFKVDKNKKDQPVLDKFDIILSADLRGTEVGFKGHKKMRYDFHMQWHPLMQLKKEIESQDPVRADKKSPFDAGMYDKALSSMLSAVIGGFKSGLASE